MIIRVHLFAGVKQIFESDIIEVTLADSATIADVRSALWKRSGDSELINRCMFAVDSEFASDDTPISIDHEIACIPPVSGG